MNRLVIAVGIAALLASAGASSVRADHDPANECLGAGGGDPLFGGTAQRFIKDDDGDGVVVHVEGRDRIRELILDPWPRVPGTNDLELAQAPFRMRDKSEADRGISR